MDIRLRGYFMDIKLDELEVKHNPAESRFETWIDGELSKLDYTEDGDTIVMMHVGVMLLTSGVVRYQSG